MGPNQPRIDAGVPRPSKGGGGILKGLFIGCGLLVLLVVAGVAIGGYMIYRSVSTDPVKVEAAAQNIVAFDKPEGFHGQMAMSMMGAKVAVLAATEGKDPNAMIVLMALPPDKTDPAEIQRQVNRKLKGETQGPVERREDEKFKVRGKETPGKVEIQRGKDEATRTAHYTFVLEGKSGESVVLLIAGDEKRVDHAWVQKFLDSIK